MFIGECKLYHGPKSVAEAIDQLLGYLVWRDTKGALLLFVRAGNFTQAVQRAVDALSAHPQCQRSIPAQDPNRRSDYLFARADDESRTIRLALLPFQLRAWNVHWLSKIPDPMNYVISRGKSSAVSVAPAGTAHPGAHRVAGLLHQHRGQADSGLPRVQLTPDL